MIRRRQPTALRGRSLIVGRSRSCAVSVTGPLPEVATAFLSRVPGTAGQPHETIENAHHFVQEDYPRRCIILQAIVRTLDDASGVSACIGCALLASTTTS